MTFEYSSIGFELQLRSDHVRIVPAARLNVGWLTGQGEPYPVAAVVNG